MNLMSTGFRRSGWEWGAVGDAAIEAAGAATSPVAPALRCGRRAGGDAPPGGMR
jgi:hypothetical protein